MNLQDFTNIKIYPEKPNINLPEDDCFEILDILNTGKFWKRENPEGNIKEFIQNVQRQEFKETGMLNCHSLVKRVIAQNPNWGWQRVSGYLIKSFIDINSYSQQQSCLKIPPDFTPDFKKSIMYLLHHSVLASSEENYIECLPNKKNYYPTEEYIFIPHSSAIKGYNLMVY